MLKKLRDKITKIMIEKWLKSLLAGFRQKNPQIFALVAMLLTAAKAAFETLITNGSVPADAAWVEWILWAIALILGSGGVAAYKYRKELADIEDDPHVAQNRTQKQELDKLREENEVLKSIVEKA